MSVKKIIPRTMLHILISFCLFTGIFAESLQVWPGFCPQMPSEFIDGNRMIGKWYDYKHSYSTGDVIGKCGTFYWYPPINGLSKVVFNTFSPLLNDNSIVAAELNLVRNELFAKLHIPILQTLKQHHYIMETDYDNYAIYWGCEQYGQFHVFYSWVKTRKLVPTIDIDRVVENAFKKRGLPLVPMTLSDQNNCSNT